MPIYEYRCQACDHELEAIQKMSDAPLVACPACEQPALKKRVSAAAFRLKGGGWYETDFKSGAKKNLAGDGAKADGGAKGESAPAGSAAGKSGGDKATSSTTSSGKDAG